MELNLQRTQIVDTPLKFEITFYKHDNKNKVSVSKIVYSGWTNTGVMMHLENHEIIDLLETVKSVLESK